MKNKFKDIGIEKDTKMLYEQEISINNIKAVHQKWQWEAVNAESFIFFNGDIKDLGEQELVHLAKSSPLYKGTSFTHTKGDIYTFINFNFKTK